MKINTCYIAGIIIVCVIFMATMSIAFIKSRHKSLGEFDKSLTESLYAMFVSLLVYLVLRCGLAFLFSTFKEQTNIETIPIKYESGTNLLEEIPGDMPIFVDNKAPTHIEEVTYTWGFLYDTEKTLYINTSGA